MDARCKQWLAIVKLAQVAILPPSSLISPCIQCTATSHVWQLSARVGAMLPGMRLGKELKHKTKTKS